MRLAAQFEKFLSDEVNLNKSRMDTLTARVDVIKQFILSSDWGPPILDFIAQGSWAHKTIIKPPGAHGFDADLVVFVRSVNGWRPQDYVLQLRRVFTNSGTYKDKIRLGNRCVTLEYAGDFSLDIVPCVVERLQFRHRFEECNRADNTHEPSNSEGFTRWLDERNAWVGNDYLRKVIRLLKYLRDIKTTFSCKSVLLSTLVGNCVTWADVCYQTTWFPDLPTSLRTLVGRLDDYLQTRPKLHKVINPTLPTEDFVRHWDHDKYENFREMIHKYRGWIDDAYSASTEAESVRKWRRIFGDSFAPNNQLVLLEIAPAIRPIDLPPSVPDAVQAVKLAGRAILAHVPSSLPWVQSPPFHAVAAERRVDVSVMATEHESKDGSVIGRLKSGAIIGKHSAILFGALAANGLPFGKDFDVQWRVVNTDHDAHSAGALRGGFYPSASLGRRWETTLYHGVHWVEAFVLRKRDRRCVGASDRFFVVID